MNLAPRILVVEDDPHVLRGLCDLIRSHGYDFEDYDARRAGSHLLVYRTVGRETGGSRFGSVHHEHHEGVALELETLERWLARQTLGDDPRIASATLEWTDAPSTRPRGAYRRRFAAPFGVLAATVTLVPLDDAPTATTIYLLALLAWLAMAAALGLAYRVSATRLRIAEQQSQFVSAVTHELRTPLTTLRMYSEMLRDGLVPADAQRDYHDAMVFEAERLSRLVENVLSHAKLGRGDRALALRPVSLPPTLRLLSSHARAHGLELRAVLPDALPAVLADPDALLQVVVNLVDNAIVHATAAEPPRVELTAEARGAHVELRVRDHGPGVPAPRLEAIFAPFVSDTEGHGVGLGLALVRALVEEMGGEVTARNAPDGGLEVIAGLRRA